MKNPILFWLIVILIGLNVLDGITFFFIKSGESNPLVVFTSSPWPLVVGKLILIVAAVWIYISNDFPSHFSYFMLMMFFVLGILALLLGVIGNFYGITHPEYVQAVSTASTATKVKSYINIVQFIYIIPTALSLVGFKLYEWSLKYITINKKKVEWK
jgi:Na+-transporting methylmalonyl-CoA/oxaloacetate decarboxylase gamma subunit